VIAAEPSRAARGEDGRTSILVLDAPEIVELIRELLDSRAVSAPQPATVVNLGPEIAFDQIVASQPSLVLIDPRFMPGTAGWTMVGRLQADPRTMHLPIIVCTARSGDDTDGHGRAGSTLQILNKPFTLQEFEGALAVLASPPA
jgi:putative two-component system response regulator